MRVADYIFKTLADFGVRHVFLVTGGGAMHLNDALGREKRIRYICNLHEQASTMAAEGYARITGNPGVVNVTTGPGGTNTLTGVAGAWLDSIPIFIISGQIKLSTCIASYPELNLRQMGDQELNIVDIVKPITKYAVMLRHPEDIRFELEKAWYLCQNGRPGPVWLDIPLDIQAAQINEKLLKGYLPEHTFPVLKEDLLSTALKRLMESKRPAIVAGIGVRQSKAWQDLLEFAHKYKIPVLTAISGIDLISSDDPFFFGRPGILGERGANFIMQNSDLLLVLGTRMGIRTIGYAYDKIAREAYKVMVDIDPAELKKPTFMPDLAINCDVGNFLRALNRRFTVSLKNEEWLSYCKRVKEKYPVVTQEHRNRTDYVSSYVLPELIKKFCQDNTIIVTGNGTAYTSTFQAMPIKRGMRMFANEACASMGYGLPAAIGAAFAGNGREVICLTGDGSLQMNIQELQTLINYHLPLKLFVYNNKGYLSIKQTQQSFFSGNFVGAEASSGIIFPDLCKLAKAYELPTFLLRNNQEAEKMLPEILSLNGPVFIEVMTDPFEVLSPKADSKQHSDGTITSAPLEDLAPFLPYEEFLENMIIPPISRS